MSTLGRMREDDVGPVLVDGEAARAIAAVLCAGNEHVAVLTRGAYLRVHAPGRCVLVRADVEAALGRPFRLPTDLEAIMPSFVGRLVITEARAEWSL